MRVSLRLHYRSTHIFCVECGVFAKFQNNGTTFAFLGLDRALVGLNYGAPQAILSNIMLSWIRQTRLSVGPTPHRCELYASASHKMMHRHFVRSSVAYDARRSIDKPTSKPKQILTLWSCFAPKYRARARECFTPMIVTDHADAVDQKSEYIQG